MGAGQHFNPQLLAFRGQKPARATIGIQDENCPVISTAQTYHTLDLGGKRVRQISTPHVPHGWEAQVLFEETTGTLLCGDLFSQVGAPPAITDEDLVDPAVAAEELFHATCLAPHTAATIRALGDLEPTTLAVMHGASYRGDGRKALYDLAAEYERMLASA